MKDRILAGLLLLGLLLLILMYGSPAVSRRLTEEDVKDIVLWQNGPDAKRVTLNREEIAAFLKHYNRAAYRGRGDGSGGTAEWGAVIVRQDGTEIGIHEFSGGPDFEVSCKALDWWFYLDSGELREYILKQLEGVDGEKEMDAVAGYFADPCCGDDRGLSACEHRPRYHHGRRVYQHQL